jgi:hypothetical protein
LGSYPPQSIKAKKNPSELIQVYVPQGSPKMKAPNAHRSPEIMSLSKTLHKALFFAKNPTIKAK